MSTRRLAIALTLASIASLLAPRDAAADLVLGFSAPTYTISSIGQTVTVGLLVSQTAGGPQVGVGNALLSAAVRLTYAPSVGTVSLSTINAPGWDSLSNSPPGSPLDISVLSLNGFTNLASPLTIANLTFQGVSPGIVTLTLQQLDPGSPDFITSGGNVLDPTNTATATINVNVIPEPSPLGLGFLMLGAAAAIRRLRMRRSS